MEIATLLGIGEWIWKHIRPAKLLIIVEDDKDDLNALRDELEEQNIKHAKARTGEEALTLMRWTRFYAALIDLGLPGMSGLELAEKIKKKGYSTRIFFVTDSSFVNLEQGQHLNIIRKPVSGNELREIIK